MATGREGRAERLNERLRGAGRANVDDDTFNLDLAGLDQPLAEPPADRSTPNAAKRRKVGSGAAAPVATEPEEPTRRSARLSPKDPFDLPSTSKESEGQANPPSPAASRRTAPGRPRQGSARPTRSPTTRLSAAPSPEALGQDELESLPAPTPVRSSRRSRTSGSLLEEIEESPANEPGGGRRISVPSSSAVRSSARLQNALRSHSNSPPSSSPLARKARTSDAAKEAGPKRTTLRRTRLSQSSEDADAPDELSPSATRPPNAPEADLSAGSRRTTDAVEQVPEPEEPAEEIGAAEAARTLRRKRPRQSQREASPQLGSNDRPAEEPSSAPRKKRGRPSRSPATQKQPARKPRQRAVPRPSTTTRRAPRAKPKAAPKSRRRRSDEADTSGQNVEVTVQRFVHHRARQRGEDADPLQLDLPFANRSGESSVDVLAQVCDEVIGNTLDQFQERLDGGADAAKKKEYRIKMRAVEAYREVLNSRLLQHTIHLDHWHSLRKRIRHAQKEKLSLREEILRMKREREQVALRMDAVRIKHEGDSEESNHLLNMSSTMRDIDRAVARGGDAPELSRKEEKEAELANLELIVAQVSSQVSPASTSGALLQELQDLNAFLERAAVALESK